MLIKRNLKIICLIGPVKEHWFNELNLEIPESFRSLEKKMRICMFSYIKINKCLGLNNLRARSLEGLYFGKKIHRNIQASLQCVQSIKTNSKSKPKFETNRIFIGVK